jgi:hypothetical protein
MYQQIGAFDPVPKAELLQRIQALKGLMAQSGIDVGIVFQNVDQFYFCGTM